MRTLITEGVARINDVAFKVPSVENPPPSSQPPEWKFLWQFVEFDRRLPENKGPGAVTNTPPIQLDSERRKATPVEVNPDAALEKVPIELFDIDPAELVLSSQSLAAEKSPIQDEAFGLPLAAYARNGINWAGQNVIKIASAFLFVMVVTAYSVYQNIPANAPVNRVPTEVKDARSDESAPPPATKFSMPLHNLEKNPEAVKPPSAPVYAARPPEASFPPVPRDEPYRREVGEIPPPDERDPANFGDEEFDPRETGEEPPQTLMRPRNSKAKARRRPKTLPTSDEFNESPGQGATDYSGDDLPEEEAE